MSARQIGVIYAFPIDVSDRFAARASAIVTDIGAMDAWWRREDPSRTPRFDLAAFPNCASTLGRLDLARVPLQRPGSAYAPLPGRFERIAEDLFGPPFAFSSEFKRYIVYYDGPVEEDDVCGTGGGRELEGPSYAIVYLQSCGGDDLGTGVVDAVVATHELLHALGAVPDGAPHTCLSSPGHVCDTETDLMFPSTRGDPLDAARLDVGRDDYYGHSGSWFDVQDSGWLSHLDAPQFPLCSAPQRRPRRDGAVRASGRSRDGSRERRGARDEPAGRNRLRSHVCCLVHRRHAGAARGGAGPGLAVHGLERRLPRARPVRRHCVGEPLRTRDVQAAIR